jgi:hypothetical protein
VISAGLHAVESVCAEIAMELEAFDPDAGIVLHRIFRNVEPLREMESGRYKENVLKALANTEPEQDVVDEYAKGILAQI